MPGGVPGALVPAQANQDGLQLAADQERPALMIPPLNFCMAARGEQARH